MNFPIPSLPRDSVANKSFLSADGVHAETSPNRRSRPGKQIPIDVIPKEPCGTHSAQVAFLPLQMTLLHTACRQCSYAEVVRCTTGGGGLGEAGGKNTRTLKYLLHGFRRRRRLGCFSFLFFSFPSPLLPPFWGLFFFFSFFFGFFFGGVPSYFAYPLTGRGSRGKRRGGGGRAASHPSRPPLSAKYVDQIKPPC